MSDVTERIQRLREETARATSGSWYRDEAQQHASATTGVWSGTADDAHVECKQDDDATHIARWDPQAATRALDLLDAAFKRHRDYGGAFGCELCQCWPCPDYTAALALLDTIDPEGAA